MNRSFQGGGREPCDLASLGESSRCFLRASLQHLHSGYVAPYSSRDPECCWLQSDRAVHRTRVSLSPLDVFAAISMVEIATPTEHVFALLPLQ